MASFEITGKLKVKNETQKVSDKFEKREFVITVDEESEYPQYISLQLTQAKCPLLDNYKIGDSVKVSFNLRGREWTGNDGITKHFNSLEAWKIDLDSKATSQTPIQKTEPTSVTPKEQKKVIETTEDDPFPISNESESDLPF